LVCENQLIWNVCENWAKLFFSKFWNLAQVSCRQKKLKEKPMPRLTVSSKTRTWQISEKPENSPSLEHSLISFRVDGSRLFVWLYENSHSRVHIPNLNVPVLFFRGWKRERERERERTTPQVIRLVFISLSILTGYSSAISELGL